MRYPSKKHAGLKLREPHGSIEWMLEQLLGYCEEVIALVSWPIRCSAQDQYTLVTHGVMAALIQQRPREERDLMICKYRGVDGQNQRSVVLVRGRGYTVIRFEEGNTCERQEAFS